VHFGHDVAALYHGRGAAVRFALGDGRPIRLNCGGSLRKEAAMAKGQLRSNRETKKPKKNAALKSKPGAPSMFTQAPKGGTPPAPRKP
jgi:hypothetical protein